VKCVAVVKEAGVVEGDGDAPVDGTAEDVARELLPAGDVDVAFGSSDDGVVLSLGDEPFMAKRLKRLRSAKGKKVCFPARRDRR